MKNTPSRWSATCLRRGLALAFVVPVTVVLISTTAHADAPPIAPLHLTYTVAGPPGECPEETTFRRLVALRLGVDPFVARGLAAERTLVVAIVGPPRTVTVTLVDAAGRALGERVIREPPPACEELVANAAFAASVAIDPTVLTRRGGETGQGREPDVAPPLPARALVPSPAPPAEKPAATPSSPDGAPALSNAEAPSFVPSIGIGAGVSVGVLPSAAFGLTLGGSLRRGHVSAGVEGHFDLPNDADVEANDAARTKVTRQRCSLGSRGSSGHAGHPHIEDHRPDERHQPGWRRCRLGGNRWRARRAPWPRHHPALRAGAAAGPAQPARPRTRSGRVGPLASRHRAKADRTPRGGRAPGARRSAEDTGRGHRAAGLPWPDHPAPAGRED